MTEKVISSCNFNKKLGRIIIGTSGIFNYEFVNDNNKII
jgi:hypothetical protein